MPAIAHTSYARLLRTLPPSDRRGPLALVLVQDDLALAQTVAHLRAAGIRRIIGLGATASPDMDHWAPFDVHKPGAMAVAANALMAACPGAWVLPCWNGERLIWPHGDSRPLSDLFAFLADERRAVLGGVVLDSYPCAGGAVGLDRLGYRQEEDGIFGGLRTRISPACPVAQRRIDRPLAVRAAPGRRFDARMRLNDPALDQLHGPWHRSPTGALVSLRVWAWLAAQSDHAARVQPLMWQGSHAFSGTARELWDLGLIEPGQWV